MTTTRVAEDVAGSPSSRRSARRAAVFLLYQRDLTDIDLDELIENAERSSGILDDFTSLLAEGVAATQDDLDRLIGRASNDWAVDRIAPLERNIMRVAAFELHEVDEVPDAVAIDEAVRLAKRYCQPEASSLVNGILGRIAREAGSGA